MLSIPKNRILEWPPNTLQKIREIHNLDKPNRIDDAIVILEEWIQKQDHFLKKDFSKEYLERCLVASKGSVEKTKKQIDRLCTLKTLLPQYFTVHNVKTEIKEIFDLASLFLLPKLTEDFYRIYCVKPNGKSISDRSMLELYQFNISVAEYLKSRDYANGFIIIYDFDKSSLGDLITKVNPIALQQFMTILMEGYGARLKALHMITKSKTIDLLIKILKQFVSEKIANRVFVHETSAELFKVVPKELLPKDYGGMQKSTEKLSQELVEELSSEEHVQYMKMMSKACTNEQLRRADKFNDEYLGMPGSFRNLKVD